jgi:hypothetical protein
MSKFETMNGNGGPDLAPVADWDVGRKEQAQLFGKEAAVPAAAAANSVLLEKGILKPVLIGGGCWDGAISADSEKPSGSSGTGDINYSEKKAIEAAKEALVEHEFKADIKPGGDRTYSMTLDGKKYEVAIEFKGAPKVCEIDENGKPKPVDDKTQQDVLDLFKDLTRKKAAISIMEAVPLDLDQQKGVELLYQAFQEQDHIAIDQLAKLFSGPERFSQVLAHLQGNFVINGENLKANYRFNRNTGAGNFMYLDNDHQRRDVLIW